MPIFGVTKVKTINNAPITHKIRNESFELVGSPLSSPNNLFSKRYATAAAIKNIEVIGISKDSVASHVKFAEKYDLPFVLLSDPELAAIKAYGVWQEKKNYGKISMGVVRSTFIIDENGYIEKVMPKVKPDTNAAEILAQI